MWAGGKIGAAAGAALGSVVPVIGTAAGGAIGGAVGGTAGYIGGNAIGENIAGAVDFSGIKEKWSTAISEMERDFAAAGPRFQSDWADITANIQAGWDNNTTYLNNKQSEFKASFNTAWDEMCQQATAKNQEWAQSFAAAKTSAGQSLDELKTWAGGVWESISQGAISTATTIKNKLSGAWEYIKDNMPSLSGPSLNFSFLDPKPHATGSSYFEGGLAQINEHGGEIVDLPQGSRIYPAATTQRIIEQQLSRNGGQQPAGVVVSGNTFVVREEADIDRIAHQLFQLMDQAELNYGGGY
jgi:hypothetical protein